MIYLLYLITAAGVVLLSIKASDYVDRLDKMTSLSGAFIGGILLSAVTSLPELFTSISSTVLLDRPGLCIGNILGSDLFNIAALSFLLLLFSRSFRSAKISKGHGMIALFVQLCYVALVLNLCGIFRMELLTVSVTSLLIIAFYAFGLKYLSADNGEQAPEDAEPVHRDLTLRQVIIRFILVSIGIVALSIAITYITDAISVKLDLGAGLAGALFLGIATSLPEVSSTIALFRMRAFDIAFGNIIGSNLFNFLILAIADVCYLGGGIYDFSDPRTRLLLLFGTIATPLFILLAKKRNKFTATVCPVLILACYLGFLLL